MKDSDLELVKVIAEAAALKALCDQSFANLELAKLKLDATIARLGLITNRIQAKAASENADEQWVPDLGELSPKVIKLKRTRT